MEHYKANCGYILGNDFDYPKLEQVFTVDRFFKRFFQGELPHYSMWVIGQGLSYAERQMLLKLQSVCPSLNFTSSIFQASNTFQREPGLESQEQLVELQHFYLVTPLHYQAELYVLGDLKTSVFMEGVDKLLRQGMAHEYPGYGLFLRNAHLLQIRRLMPLGLSIEARLEKYACPNNQCISFKGKARFYQEGYCVAEINLQFDLEEKKITHRHLSQAADRVFNKELH